MRTMPSRDCSLPDEDEDHGKREHRRMDLGPPRPVGRAYLTIRRDGHGVPEIAGEKDVTYTAELLAVRCHTSSIMYGRFLTRFSMSS
jgi:hypothetical protein